MKAPTRAPRVSHSGHSANIVSAYNIGTARTVVSIMNRLLGWLKVADEGATRVDKEKNKVKEATVTELI